MRSGLDDVRRSLMNSVILKKGGWWMTWMWDHMDGKKRHAWVAAPSLGGGHG